MAVLASLAERLSDLRTEALDEQRADTVRQRIFDGLGAAAVGLATEEGRLLAALDAGWGTPDVQRDARDRCSLLVGATRATEIDDIDIGSCTTVGAVVVPVALTLASGRAAQPAETIDNDRLLAAIVVGYEAMIRLGRSIDGARLIYRGIWPTYVTAAFASAATAASLMALDAEQLEHALGIALSRVAIISRSMLARKAQRHYALGRAAIDGWAAANAAAAGLTTADDSLESFAESVDAVLDVTRLTEHRDEPAVREVDTKCFPTSRQALASVEAFTGLLPLQLDEIDSIEVYVPAAYRDMVDQPELPSARIASMLGVQYQMALAALGSISFYDAVRARLPRDPPIQAWMAKIRVHADDDLTREFPAAWGSRVVVRRSSGSELAAQVLEPTGSSGKPLSWTGLQNKLQRILAAGGLTQSSVSVDLYECCQSLASGSRVGAPQLLELAGHLGRQLLKAQPQSLAPETAADCADTLRSVPDSDEHV